MNDKGLSMEGVSLYPAHNEAAAAILDSITIHFPRGEATLIVGPVGAGKSTLIHLLAGLRRPTRGIIRADGAPVSKYTMPHLDRWRATVGIVFQHLELLEDRSVRENVLLPLIPQSGRYSSKVGIADKGMDDVGIAHLASSTVSLLSGGERQRTAIARALVNRPAFLLTDEPTAHLDDADVRQFLSIIDTCVGSGGTVVTVSHDPRLSESDAFHCRHRLVSGRLEPKE
jgi:ABC-type lipoprotein export system ATPase subunit